MAIEGLYRPARKRFMDDGKPDHELYHKYTWWLEELNASTFIACHDSVDPDETCWVYWSNDSATEEVNRMSDIVSAHNTALHALFSELGQ